MVKQMLDGTSRDFLNQLLMSLPIRLKVLFVRFLEGFAENFELIFHDPIKLHVLKEVFDQDF